MGEGHAHVVHAALLLDTHDDAAGVGEDGAHPGVGAEGEVARDERPHELAVAGPGNEIPLIVAETVFIGGYVLAGLHFLG